jgi:hypothetical protein
MTTKFLRSQQHLRQCCSAFNSSGFSNFYISSYCGNNFHSASTATTSQRRSFKFSLSISACHARAATFSLKFVISSCNFITISTQFQRIFSNASASALVQCFNSFTRAGSTSVHSHSPYIPRRHHVSTSASFSSAPAHQQHQLLPRHLFIILNVCNTCTSSA